MSLEEVSAVGGQKGSGSGGLAKPVFRENQICIQSKALAVLRARRPCEVEQITSIFKIGVSYFIYLRLLIMKCDFI